MYRPEVVYLDNDYFDTDAALAQLLTSSALFCNTRAYAMEAGQPVEGKTIVLFVNCNDVFAWGCADAEDITEDEIKDLYKLEVAHPSLGSTIWVCLKRKQKPQAPVAALLKENNAWSDELEALPDNLYDKMIDNK